MKNLLVLALVLLSMLFLSTPASAQAPKVIYDPVLAGGEVYVQGILHVIFVGDERTPVRPQTVETSWITRAPDGKARKVSVREARFLGQSKESWLAEHARLVAKVAAVFPPTTAKMAEPMPTPRRAIGRASRIARRST